MCHVREHGFEKLLVEIGLLLSNYHRIKLVAPAKYGTIIQVDMTYFTISCIYMCETYVPEKKICVLFMFILNKLTILP